MLDADTGHEIRTGTKRSLDQLIELRITELKGVLTQKVELKSRV